MKIRAVTSITITSLLALSAWAHEGFDHVMGIVVTSANHVLTVKTTRGNVTVKLDDKTEITKDNKKALPADLKTGVRVVVDIPEGSADKIAHSVKIGAAAAVDDHAEHAH